MILRAMLIEAFSLWQGHPKQGLGPHTGAKPGEGVCRGAVRQVSMLELSQVRDGEKGWAY